MSETTDTTQAPETKAPAPAEDAPPASPPPPPPPPSPQPSRSDSAIELAKEVARYQAEAQKYQREAEAATRKAAGLESTIGKMRDNYAQREAAAILGAEMALPPIARKALISAEWRAVSGLARGDGEDDGAYTGRQVEALRAHLMTEAPDIFQRQAPVQIGANLQAGPRTIQPRSFYPTPTVVSK